MLHPYYLITYIHIYIYINIFTYVFVYLYIIYILGKAQLDRKASDHETAHTTGLSVSHSQGSLQNHQFQRIQTAGLNVLCSRTAVSTCFFPAVLEERTSWHIHRLAKTHATISTMSPSSAIVQ